jgi:hypothetical protein
VTIPLWVFAVWVFVSLVAVFWSGQLEHAAGRKAGRDEEARRWVARMDKARFEAVPIFGGPAAGKSISVDALARSVSFPLPIPKAAASYMGPDAPIMAPAPRHYAQAKYRLEAKLVPDDPLWPTTKELQQGMPVVVFYADRTWDLGIVDDTYPLRDRDAIQVIGQETRVTLTTNPPLRRAIGQYPKIVAIVRAMPELELLDLWQMLERTL